SNDDGGEGTNSRIPPSGTFTLPTSGVYTVEASAYDSNATGSYTLLVTNVPLPTTRQCSSISFNQSVTGSLNSSDLPSRYREGSNSDCYTFNGNAGDRIVVTLNSSVFDAYVYLTNSSGTLLAEDDDSGGNSNARIPATGSLTLSTS